MRPLRTALDRGALSVRGVDRSLRVAWTLCDLAGRDSPSYDDVTTALSFRQAGGM
jgi:magnesium chelatase family protein